MGYRIEDVINDGIDNLEKAFRLERLKGEKGDYIGAVIGLIQLFCTQKDYIYRDGYSGRGMFGRRGICQRHSSRCIWRERLVICYM